MNPRVPCSVMFFTLHHSALSLTHTSEEEEGTQKDTVMLYEHEHSMVDIWSKEQN